MKTKIHCNYGCKQRLHRIDLSFEANYSLDVFGNRYSIHLSLLVLVSLFYWASCSRGSSKGVQSATSRSDAELPPAQAVKLVTQNISPLNGHQEDAKSHLLELLAEENKRSMDTLSKDKEFPVYFLAYRVHEKNGTIIEASDGAITVDTDGKSRALDADVRVGKPTLDSSRRLEDPQLAQLTSFRELSLIPHGEEDEAIKHHLWLATDRKYREASLMQRLVTMEDRLKDKKKKRPADFSHYKSQFFIQPIEKFKVNKGKWIERIRQCSKRAKKGVATRGTCRLDAEQNISYYVNSEGSLIQQAWTNVRFTVSVGVKAKDGMGLGRMEQSFAATPGDLPSVKEVDLMIDRINLDLDALHDAPVVDPYVGPAILEGRAAAVWFHEVFGHRIEGHRQKDKNFGQTFTKAVGTEIMPPWLSVYDDPTIRTLNNKYLNGFYRFDDEGVPGQKASLVDKGVLKGFVVGRTPIKGMAISNGHGRAEPGLKPVSRQGNLVVEASRSVSVEKLYDQLKKEARKQGKPYGMVFSDISGGFTNTSRFGAQSFVVSPIMAYRLYPDGKKELVRGVNMSGQPLTALDNILSAGRLLETFNGMCGAESGWVPVSASAPSLLLSSLEIERGFEPQNKGPLLPPPAISKAKGQKNVQ